jgi:hypothetical protein
MTFGEPFPTPQLSINRSVGVTGFEAVCSGCSCLWSWANVKLEKSRDSPLQGIIGGYAPSHGQAWPSAREERARNGDESAELL